MRHAKHTTIFSRSLKISLKKTAHAYILLTLVYYLIFTVTYRRDRSIRDAYEERFMTERPVSVHTKASQCTSASHPAFCSYSILVFFLYCGRVHIQGQLEQWRGEAPLVDQRMITTVGDMNMMEVRAFSRMEGARETTMKISGVTMVKMCISLLNAEQVHLQEEWEHTIYNQK